MTGSRGLDTAVSIVEMRSSKWSPRLKEGMENKRVLISRERLPEIPEHSYSVNKSEKGFHVSDGLYEETLKNWVFLSETPKLHSTIKSSHFSPEICFFNNCNILYEAIWTLLFPLAFCQKSWCKLRLLFAFIRENVDDFFFILKLIIF